MRIRARLPGSIVLAALATSLGACTTWGRQRMPAPGQDRFFATARVTRAEGPPLLLDNVTVGRDSLVGREPTGARTRVAIPLSDVRTVEARRTDPLGTAAVVVVTVVGVIALWAAYALRSLGTDF